MPRDDVRNEARRKKQAANEFARIAHAMAPCESHPCHIVQQHVDGSTT